MDEWETLIVMYADGRPPCNCRQAYYTPCGVGYFKGQHRTDLLACQHGCSANQIAAKSYVATRVIADLNNGGARRAEGHQPAASGSLAPTSP